MRRVLLSMLFMMAWSRECVKRFYWEDSFVCVCNQTYCDDHPQLGDLSGGRVNVFTSDMKRERFTKTEVQFGPRRPASPQLFNITIDLKNRRQKIIGFGGCINDAVIYSMEKTPELQAQLFDQFYGTNGIEYSASRVPVGANDASVRPWSYLDTPEDYELDHFTLAPDPKLHFLRKVKRRVPDLKLFGAAWSVPGWMKNTGNMTGWGRIRYHFLDHFWILYAKYLVRFLEEFKKEGVEFWGITVMNEPGVGNTEDYRWPATFISNEQQRDFVEQQLGPLIRENDFINDVQIIAHDWRRDKLWEAAQVIYGNQTTPRFVDGLSVHWYAAGGFDQMDRTHAFRPDKFIWGTEAVICGLRHHFGKWESAELYAADIIDNLRHWSGGWVEWSLWTDTQGGPSYVGNFVDNSVAVNRTANEFYKQPHFYAIGHFSKFMRPDSVVLGAFAEQSWSAAAVERPDGKLVLVLLNRDPSRTFQLDVWDGRKDGTVIPLSLRPHSMQTVVWQKPDLYHKP